MSYKKIIVLTILSVIFFSFGSLNQNLKIYASSCVWNGSINGNWSNPGNWNVGCSGAGGIPGNNDSLSMPLGAANLTNTNDISGLSINSISFASGLCNTNLGTINIGAGGILVPSNFPIVTGNITLSVASQVNTTGTGALGLNGSINLNGFDIKILSNGSGINLSSNISGAGNITFTGNNNINLSSSLTNSGSTTIINGSTLNTLAVNKLNPTGNLILNGTLNISGGSQTVGVLQGNSTAVLNLGTSTLTTQQTASSNFSGNVIGSGNIVISSSNSLNFPSGTSNSFTGNIHLTAVSGAINMGNINFSKAKVIFDSSVVGNDSILNFTNNSPIIGDIIFNSYNDINLSNTTSTIKNLNLNSTDKFITTINSNSDFGNLVESGVPILSNAVLKLQGSYVPTNGDILTILQNNSGSPVSGIFASLPEGATIPFNGGNFTITYAGGESGHDIFLSSQYVNTPPSNLVLIPGSGVINEGSSVSLSGNFTDPDVLDTHQLVFTWGDASPNSIINLGANLTSFSGVTHTYKDNGNYSVLVTVTDSNNNNTNSTTNILVNNVAPTLNSLILSPNNIVLGKQVNISANIVDPGILDSEIININWGDGSVIQIANYIAGTTNFNLNHVFNSTGIFIPKVTVTDKDGGTNTYILQSIIVTSSTLATTGINIPYLFLLGLIGLTSFASLKFYLIIQKLENKLKGLKNK